MSMADPYGVNAQYNGEFFDSRTEAAWAVCFDAAGVEYVHEPETFHFDITRPDGSTAFDEYYTPDFYLPDHELYVEVKNDSVEIVALQKLILVAAATGHTALLVDGKPHNSPIYFYEPRPRVPMADKANNRDHMLASDHWAPNFRWMANPDDYPTPIAEIARVASPSLTGWDTYIDPAVKAASKARKKEMFENARQVTKQLG